MPERKKRRESTLAKMLRAKARFQDEGPSADYVSGGWSRYWYCIDNELSLAVKEHRPWFDIELHDKQ